MNLTPHQVLRALSRFDSATVEDVATAVHRSEKSQQHQVWVKLRKLVADGLAVRDDGKIAKYAVTEAGRAKARAV